ncbi:MAG: hypothetical protein JST54_01035 [Deltaproteobacteria bacterium]|nr:hypothetical protein [Deltaproteobacteria bacterium]
MGRLAVFAVIALARLLSCSGASSLPSDERVTAEGEVTLWDGSKLEYRTHQGPPSLRFRGERSGAGPGCVFAVDVTPDRCGGWQHDPAEVGTHDSWEILHGASGESFVACGRRFQCPRTTERPTLDSPDSVRTLATSTEVDDAGATWRLTTQIEPGEYVFGCSAEQADGTRSASIHISQSGCRASTSFNARGEDADGRDDFRCGELMMVCGSWYPCTCLPPQGGPE